MKTIISSISLLLAMFTLTAHGQYGSGVRVPGSYTTATPGPAFDIVGRTMPPAEKTSTAKDPLRLIGGQVWNVTTPLFTNGWVTFEGKVVEVQSKKGVRIRGDFDGLNHGSEDADFFVENFPYEVAEGDRLEMDPQTRTFFCARMAGVYTYHTVMGSSRTIKKLDYGEIYIPPPPTDEQIAAAKAAKEKKKKEVEASTVKWTREQADAGDAFYQLRMGERYLQGDGVDKDEAKAREYLTKAAARGNADAKELLQKIPQQISASKE